MPSETLQVFRGAVQEVGSETFWADLFDETEPNNPQEFAELLLSEVSKQDRPLLKPGAVFRWVISRETTASGQVQLVSEIRFK